MVDLSQIPPIGTRVEIVHVEPYLKGDLLTTGKIAKLFTHGYITSQGVWDWLNRDPSNYKTCHMVSLEINSGDKKEKFSSFRVDQIRSIKILGRK